jgi:spore maturation protein CgeB
MRIFLALHPSANISVPGSMTWYHNLYEPLIDLGHEVFFLRLDELAVKSGYSFRSKKFKEFLSREIVSVFKREHIKKPFNLFFSYLTDNDVEETALRLLKAYGVPMVNFSCNNIHQFHLVSKISPFFDASLHSEKGTGDLFRSIGASPVWFPMAANPNYYFPIKLPYKYDVTFIGAAYAKRSNYVWHLLNCGIDIKCFGPNWNINPPHEKLKKVHKEISRIISLMRSFYVIDRGTRYSISSIMNYYDLQSLIRKKFPENLNHPLKDMEVISIYYQTRINLGFLEVFSENQSSPAILTHHLHLREFEVPMSRGLYMTNFSEELSEFYEPDEEIIVFHNEHDLTGKIRYYLSHETEAENIREKGYQRALKSHTYQKRFSDLFSQMNF